ncbi:16705_t:CDS:2 [Gigaspora rosea]|nr:16705_t:CDS:2 [Gigaspora rosea]
MAKKFHISAHSVYEIWEHNECLQQDFDNQNDFLSLPYSNEDRLKADLEKLMKNTERLAPICPPLS